MQKGIKFRIYPNRKQKNLIHRTLGCCRLIYNRELAMRKEGYENGKKIGYTHCITAVFTGSRPGICEFFSKEGVPSNLQK